MRIVDLHHWKGPAIYCGRQMFRRRGSPLGNPFKPRDHGVETLKRYQEWLERKIADFDPAVIFALKEIREDSTLACWCVDLEGDAVFAEPLVCHCQIIARVCCLWSPGKDSNVEL